MFYKSPKHLSDTMFVVLCVVAGATSHIIPNTSKTYINQLNNHYRASFIDFILDSSFNKLLHTENTINESMATLYTRDHESIATKLDQKSQTVCALMSNFLHSDQLEFCLRHQDVLEKILPQIIQLTKKECTRITADFRWNCAAIDHLLDRSNPLAFTKEAALVRSIMNASMMYLVVKICIDGSYRSCGCHSIHYSRQLSRYPILEEPSSAENKIDYVSGHRLSAIPYPVDRSFSPSDLSTLDSGLPLRLSSSINQRRGCRANIGFANAFTKFFIDLDDLRALNKAYRVLNEDQNHNRYRKKSSNVKRIVDSDNKDLARIKWIKSAINLHNNHLGREFVREAIQLRCRCHGLSGICQFQTCWDHLLDFEFISSKIRAVYIYNSTRVQVSNIGSLEKPDLILIKAVTHESLQSTGHLSIDDREEMQRTEKPTSTGIQRIRPNEFIYLYNSPDYCESQPDIGHLGTMGRACADVNNITISEKTSKKSPFQVESNEEFDFQTARHQSIGIASGSCKQLCCDRGHRSEMMIHVVTCNCRFKYCCKIDCDYCLRQSLKHFCL